MNSKKIIVILKICLIFYPSLENLIIYDIEQENENESAVIQVIKLADDQLKDIVKYWQTTTTSSTNRISITSTNSEPSKDQVPQVSFF